MSLVAFSYEIKTFQECQLFWYNRRFLNIATATFQSFIRSRKVKDCKIAGSQTSVMIVRRTNVCLYLGVADQQDNLLTLA